MTNKRYFSCLPFANTISRPYLTNKGELFVRACVKVCVELSCVLLRKVRQIQTSVVRGKVVILNGSASIYTACVG